MAFGTIFDVIASTDKGDLSIKLTYSYSDILPSEIQFELILGTSNSQSTSKFRGDITNPAVTANLSINDVISDPFALCLMACVGGVVIKPIAECFNKDVKRYVHCLKSKGLAISGEVIACAIECAAK